MDLLTWQSQRIAYMELRIVLRINQNEVTWWLYGGQEEGSNLKMWATKWQVRGHTNFHFHAMSIVSSSIYVLNRFTPYLCLGCVVVYLVIYL